MPAKGKSEKYLDIKEDMNDRNLPTIERANFRAYLDGLLSLYDSFREGREYNKNFKLKEDVRRLFDQTNKKIK